MCIHTGARGTLIVAASGCAGPGRAERAWCRALGALLPTLLLAASSLCAQVESIATVAPVLSPVEVWRTAAANAGPAAMANTLTLRLNSGAIQDIPFLTDNRVNSFPSPVSVTTEWTLGATASTVDLVGYFPSALAALSGPTYDIASSRVNGRMITGQAVTFTPFDGNAMGGVGTPGATLHLFRQPIIAQVNGMGTRTDNLELQLDLRGLPKLPAGTYRGTLTLRAVAY